MAGVTLAEPTPERPDGFTDGPNGCKIELHGERARHFNDLLQFVNDANNSLLRSAKLFPNAMVENNELNPSITVEGFAGLMRERLSLMIAELHD